MLKTDFNTSDTFPKFLEELIKEGVPISSFMVDNKLPQSFYRYAKVNGWTLAARKKNWAQGLFAPTKRTLAEADIVRLHKAVDPTTSKLYTLKKIGELAGGVSRQRIEQILSRLGLSSRKTPERVAWRKAQLEEEEREHLERVEAHRAMREATVQELHNMYLPAITMWNGSKTLQNIADLYHRELNSMAWLLHTLNERHGWFPRRGVENRQGRFSKEAKEQGKLDDEKEYSKARKMWAEGYAVSEIAETYTKPRTEMSWILFNLNTKYEWFPRRNA